MIGGPRGWVLLAVALGIGLAVTPAASALVEPVPVNLPVGLGPSTVWLGVASQDSEHHYERSGLCGTAVTTFAYELRVEAPAPPGDPAHKIRMEAPHWDGDGFVTRSATATYGDPGHLVVQNKTTCTSWTITGEQVATAAPYTMTEK